MKKKIDKKERGHTIYKDLWKDSSIRNVKYWGWGCGMWLSR